MHKNEDRGQCGRCGEKLTDKNNKFGLDGLCDNCRDEEEQILKTDRDVRFYIERKEYAKYI